MNNIDMLAISLSTLSHSKQKQAFEVLYSKLKAKNETLLIQLVKFIRNAHALQHIQIAQILSIILSKALISKNSNYDVFDFLQHIKAILTDQNVNTRVKKHILEHWFLWVSTEQKENHFIIQESIDRMLSETMTLEEQKGQLQSFVAEKDRCQQFYILALQAMSRCLSKVKQKIKYMNRVMSIVKKYHQRKEYQTPDITRRVSILHILLTYLRQISVLSQQQSSKELILKMLFNTFELHQLISSSITCFFIKHQHFSSFCAFCPRSCQTGQRIDETDLKIKIFQIIFIIIQLQQQKLVSFFNEEGQNQLYEAVIVGLKCFLIDCQLQQQKFDQQSIKKKQELACILIKIYTFFIKMDHSKILYLFQKSPHFKSQFLFNLLELTPNETIMFTKDSELFISKFVQDRNKDTDHFRQLVFKVFNQLVHILDHNSSFFINTALYNIQKNHKIYFFESWKSSKCNYYLSTRSCYILLLMVWQSRRSQKQREFFLKMCEKQVVALMDDVTLTLALIFMQQHMTSMFEKFSERHWKIVDIGLRSKQTTVRFAALNFLQSVSIKTFSSRHLANINKKLFLGNEKSIQEYNILWNIMKTILQYHFNKIDIYMKSLIIKLIRTSIAEQLLNSMKHKTFNYNLVYNCIELFLIYVSEMEKEKIHAYQHKAALDIISFYQHLPFQSLKDLIRNSFNTILKIQFQKKGPIATQVFTFMNMVLHQYSQKRDSQVLQLINNYLRLIYSKSELQNSKDRIIIFQTLFQQLSKNYRRINNQSLSLPYSELMLLQLYILNFGAQINYQYLNELCSICWFILTQNLPQRMGDRAKNTIFACSLFLPCFDFFQEMIQFNKAKIFKGMQYEMLVFTIETCFRSRNMKGGIEKYKHLIQLLYILFTHKIHFDNGIEQKQAFKDIIFKQTLKSSQEARVKCLEAYSFFKNYKNLAYLYLMDTLPDHIRKFFICVDNQLAEKQTNKSMGQTYDPQKKQFLKELCPSVLELNPYLHLKIGTPETELNEWEFNELQ